MRNFMFVLLTAAMAVSAEASGDTPNEAVKDARVAKAKKCVFPHSRKRAPDWVCHAQPDKLALAAVGSFYKSGAGAEFVQQMAAADARVQLARKLREPVLQTLAASANAATNNDAEHDRVLLGRIIDEKLQGTRILQSAYGPGGKLYVLIGMDEAGTQKLREAIAADYIKQQR